MSPRPIVALALSVLAAACSPKTAAEAETRKDVAWLAANPTGESVAALGRLADSDPRALAALEERAEKDVNVHIASWAAITRDAKWGGTLMRASLGDPMRAEMAASALPRSDRRLVPFIEDIEGALLRLSAGKRGSVLAGILASIGPEAHAAVERRLLDAKTRGAMCDGIALPEASKDARTVLLAVPADARDSPACVAAILGIAANDDVVLDWIATDAEPGMLGAAAKSPLPCPRLAPMWAKALTERPPQTHSAITVPLQWSVSRCATTIDSVLADVLAKSPRVRATILQGIDPFGTELSSLKETCSALKQGFMKGESAVVRARAAEALSHGCAFAR
ncbi:MAG TPA: hypothetical protein VM580_30065 [Labilithrix sp.]|nr:hypothetical protein [Labilithrix sp.]